uniref:Uncharacterized protein n=1 Tax=Arundo donax TaxID=35708 RepID=A0A0A8ZW71_ARUDO
MRQTYLGLMWHDIISHLLAGLIGMTCKCDLAFMLSVLKEFYSHVDVLPVGGFCTLHLFSKLIYVSFLYTILKQTNKIKFCLLPFC